MVDSAVLAVDGGNSKADVALVAADGTLLAAVHGPTISHQQVGLAQGMATLRKLADRAASEAGLGEAARDGHDRAALATLGVYCLAGADYPTDVRLLTRGIEDLGLTGETVVLNDTFAALRAGTSRPWGVALICGRGINACAVAPNGRSARFDAVGTYSGDWGGGLGVGHAGLSAAVRGRDGRGGRTILERVVPEHFRLRSPAALTKALYEERIEDARLLELAPVVFDAATSGDAVARSIVDRLADELAAMAGALIRRLHMTRLDPEVVLAGGVFRATDRAFYDRLEAGVQAVAPLARTVRLTAPPVLGSALIGLDRLSGSGQTPPAAEARLRAALERWADSRPEISLAT
ncbi:MAG TPA: BadF/BadG/BcrA/BcrD ATPase family protein [Candidatus Limnocylindrales bacterium]|nr:BadF/BadG/BcrA/BcrD ATPase family protein [Candidatus Limnocylindrales bacterium]